MFSRGLIYRTFNGGNKWSLCHDTLKPSLNFVYVKAQEIYAGGYGIVIKSYDMGTSWDTLIIVGDNVLGKSFGPQISKVYRLNQATAASAADYLATLGASMSKVDTLSSSTSSSSSAFVWQKKRPS